MNTPNTHENTLDSENPAPTQHVSVLLKESIEGLNLQSGDIYLDGTLGGAGHMLTAIGEIKKIGGKLTAIGLDRDIDALERAKHVLHEVEQSDGIKVHLECMNFNAMDAVLDELGIPFVDKIILDLGLSSDQFEQSGRGFTFKKNEPLLMNFSKDASVTAREIVNTWSQDEIADIIYKYGEETYAKRIAKVIVERRESQPIETTFDLVDIVKSATPIWYHHGKTHPATKTFQALRIAVNDELGSLSSGLEVGFNRLRAGGRIAVITFHSLEDRMVKQFFGSKVEDGSGELVNKKPIVASREELDRNPRSRSAKLRILIKK